MNKDDLIYDAVLRIEKRFDEELKPIKKDIEGLKEFKNKLLGITAIVSLAISGFVAWFKNTF